MHTDRVVAQNALGYDVIRPGTGNVGAHVPLLFDAERQRQCDWGPASGQGRRV